jgi:hypothetical protein
MPFTVTTRTTTLTVEAEEHRVEGGHHVFRRSTTVMGAPRLAVVRRLPAADVLAVTPARRKGPLT